MPDVIPCDPETDSVASSEVLRWRCS
jgi:hypothetical protein